MSTLPTIWLDMDGTIADLYAVENWLTLLRNEDTTPYKIAKPLLTVQQIEWLKGYIKQGGKIGVISWTSKTGTREYNREVRATKKEWLNKHLPLEYTEIHIVKYGTNKARFGKIGDILVDDENQNLINFRKTKNKMAFHPNEWNKMLEKLNATLGLKEE